MPLRHPRHLIPRVLTISIVSIGLVSFSGAHADTPWFENEFVFGASHARQNRGESVGPLVEYLPSLALGDDDHRAAFGLDLGATNIKGAATKKAKAAYFVAYQYGVFQAFQFARHFEARLSIGFQTWNGRSPETSPYLGGELRYLFSRRSHRALEGVYVFYNDVFHTKRAELYGGGLVFHLPDARPREPLVIPVVITTPTPVAVIPATPTPATPIVAEAVIAAPIIAAPSPAVSVTTTPAIESVPVAPPEPTAVAAEPSEVVPPAKETTEDLAKVLPLSRSESGTVIKIDSGSFAAGSAYVGKAYAARLAEIGPILARHPEAHVTVEGHTDDQGPEADRIAIAQKRADVVKDLLIKSGVNADQVTATGYGSTKPVAGNASPEQWAQNRRVVLRLREAPAPSPEH